MEEIDKLKKEAADKLLEAERLEKLKKLFPDLQKHEGRWKKIVYCSPSVNSKVTNYERRYNCGCCNDSPLEIWPYLETEHGRVYSVPAYFRPGQKHWICGATPDNNWKEDFIKNGIPQAIIDRVTDLFKSDREERIRLASGE